MKMLNDKKGSGNYFLYFILFFLSIVQGHQNAFLSGIAWFLRLGII